MKYTKLISSLLTVLVTPALSIRESGPIRKRTTNHIDPKMFDEKEDFAEAFEFGRMVEELLDLPPMSFSFSFSFSYSLSYDLDTDHPSLSPYTTSMAPSKTEDLSNSPSTAPTLYVTSSDNGTNRPTLYPTAAELDSNDTESPTQGPSQKLATLEPSALPTVVTAKPSSLPTIPKKATAKPTVLPTKATSEPTPLPTHFVASNDSASPTKSPITSVVANNSKEAVEVDTRTTTSPTNSQGFAILGAGLVTGAFVVGFAVRAIDRRNGPTEYLNLDGDSHSSFSLQA